MCKENSSISDSFLLIGILGSFYFLQEIIDDYDYQLIDSKGVDRMLK